MRRIMPQFRHRHIGLLYDLCSVADCVLLLTATPLHLKNDDLFNLLHALRPTEFRDPYVFDALARFSPVHRASARAGAEP